MWVPASASDVERAVRAGELEETHTFDAKLLPGRNKDIAIDVCAMTVDSGSLLYGVGEDEERRLTRLDPFELVGVRERIDQVVQTSIAEPPAVTIAPLALDTDPSLGYIVVAVPQSPRAPHMVTVGGDLRYYGRGATGNRQLTESEVAALYARRDRWSVDRDGHLGLLVGDAPIEMGATWVFLHAFARPIGFDENYLRSQIASDENALRDALVRAAGEVEPRERYMPALESLRGWGWNGAEGLRIGDLSDPRSAIEMRVAHTGETRLFACVGDTHSGHDQLVFFDHGIAGNLASFFAATGVLLTMAGFPGAVDVGVALTGLRNAVSYFALVRGYGRPGGYPHDSYTATDRTLARELFEQPRDLSMRLLRRFFDATVSMDFEPLV